MSAKLSLTHLKLGLAGLPADHITIYTPSPPDGTLHIALGTEETGLTDIGIFNSGGISLNSVPQIPIGQYDNYSGEVVQRAGNVYSSFVTGTTLLPIDDTLPQNTEGTQFLSESITPLYADSILYVEVGMMLSLSAIGWISAAMFRDADANAIAAKAAYLSTANGALDMHMVTKVVAGSTAATTFNVRVGSNAASTVRMNGTSARLFGGLPKSYMLITEVRP